MTRNIRPGVPGTLRDLNAAVGRASNTVFELHIESPPEAFDAAADQLHAAFEIARDLARPPSITGCAVHPYGPVEAEETRPEGWGKCLLCNTNQRRATATNRRRPPTEERT